MENFNFGEYLLEKGFAFTNYGTHNLYEFAKDDHNFAVNIQGDKYTASNSLSDDNLEKDLKLPKNAKEADTWLSSFLGEKKTAAKK